MRNLSRIVISTLIVPRACRVCIFIDIPTIPFVLATIILVISTVPVVISTVPVVISTGGRDLKPPLTQVLPFRIDSSNKIVFLLSTPFLDFPLPCYRGADIRRFLEIDELVNIVLFRKARNHLRLVLMHPSLKIIGYADIHDLVILVRQ